MKTILTSLYGYVTITAAHSSSTSSLTHATGQFHFQEGVYSNFAKIKLTNVH